jgi:hypothetical protein
VPNPETKALTKGQLIDAYSTNLRRLNITHWILGAAASFCLWLKPGTFKPYLPRVFSRGEVVPIIVNTVTAWAPYIISYRWSRHLLASRSQSATVLFILFSVIVCSVASGLYFPIILITQPSPMQIGVGTALALGAASYICARVWPQRFA